MSTLERGPRIIETSHKQRNVHLDIAIVSDIFSKIRKSNIFKAFFVAGNWNCWSIIYNTVDRAVAPANLSKKTYGLLVL